MPLFPFTGYVSVRFRCTNRQGALAEVTARLTDASFTVIELYIRPIYAADEVLMTTLVRAHKSPFEQRRQPLLYDELQRALSYDGSPASAFDLRWDGM
jgi:hypothetical protein